MNINGTLAKYFEDTIPENDSILNEHFLKQRIPEFLRESDIPKKYELAQQLIKSILGLYSKDKVSSPN